MKKLKLEIRNGQLVHTDPVPNVMITPPIGEDFWLFRVMVSDHQALLAFPKFTTIGIGFAIEEDWNTNLPYSLPAEDIWKHIRHNKGDDTIPDQLCIDAIIMLQDAIKVMSNESEM